MSTVEEKLAKSLTAESVELIPYLPYLLQDLWELGSSPPDIISLITKHADVSGQPTVLDLACGKGAVSIQLAKELGCQTKGIDLIPEFIDFAQKKAQEYAVEHLCTFVVGDINKVITVEQDYDIVVLGAVGDVLGTPAQTIRILKRTVKRRGYILIGDAYARTDASINCISRESWLTLFDKAGVTLLGEKISAATECKQTNDQQQAAIVLRANELTEKYPDKAALFDRYLQCQQAECDELENEVSAVTMLLQVNA